MNATQSALARAYIECALWSSTDSETSRPLDATHTVFDFAPETLAAMEADCERFARANESLMDEADISDAQAGHDFWLTRNGHGAGFWDRGLGEVGDRLTDACKGWREVGLYVGDDGLIYQA